MNRKVIIGIILFFMAILAIALVFLWRSPRIEELYIKNQISKANYCTVDSDCVDAGRKCPFGCWLYVNKNEVSGISGLVSSFDSTCIYSCLACPTAVCENNQCKEVCE